MDTFAGFVRPDGSAGIRNHVAVIPTVSCANGVAANIARAVPGAVALLHAHGCGRAMEIGMHARTLAGLGANPNVASALVVGLGCETVQAAAVAAEIAKTGKPCAHLVIQEQGGSRRTTEEGVRIVKGFMDEASAMERRECPLSLIIIGLECGGSDAFSGVTANPAVGLVSDWLVSKGGSVILTESTEMIGTAHILSRRARNAEVAAQVEGVVSRAYARTKDILGELATYVIAPGNMDGGLSSIREKSLGCIEKGGRSMVTEVVDYGQAPKEKGLIVMDAPGYDTESMASLAAAGCQLIVFTTGRGTPVGFPILPVIKVASTSRLYALMEDDMDVNAGVVLEGGSLEGVAGTLQALAVEVMNGARTRAEENGQDGIVCLAAMTPAF
jgi:altronate dehydratase large subunit